jgi:RNase P subunit RPR2
LFERRRYRNEEQILNNLKKVTQNTTLLWSHEGEFCKKCRSIIVPERWGDYRTRTTMGLLKRVAMQVALKSVLEQ